VSKDKLSKNERVRRAKKEYLEGMVKYKGIDFKVMRFGLLLPNGEYATYESILRILHPEINWFFLREKAYHGEWFAVGFERDGAWFYQQGSFGSCRVCDMLGSVMNEEDAEEVLKIIDNIVKIGVNWKEAKGYLKKEMDNLWSGAKEVLKRLINIIERVKGVYFDGILEGD